MSGRFLSKRLVRNMGLQQKFKYIIWFIPTYHFLAEAEAYYLISLVGVYIYIYICTYYLAHLRFIFHITSYYLTKPLLSSAAGGGGKAPLVVSSTVPGATTLKVPNKWQPKGSEELKHVLPPGDSKNVRSKVTGNLLLWCQHNRNRLQIPILKDF